MISEALRKIPSWLLLMALVVLTTGLPAQAFVAADLVPSSSSAPLPEDDSEETSPLEEGKLALASASRPTARGAGDFAVKRVRQARSLARRRLGPGHSIPLLSRHDSRPSPLRC